MLNSKSLKISLFDLDHTLITINSSFAFGSYLKAQGHISKYALIFPLAFYASHLLGITSIGKLHNIAFKRIFRGKSQEMVRDWAQSFVDEHFDKVCYSPALQRLKEAQSSDQRTILLSSSPSFIVEPFAKRLLFDEWIASEYGVDSQQCFDRISRLIQGIDKANYINHLEGHGILKQNITAYTDSHHDLPFLLSAGNAIGVNPNSRLRRECLNRGWEVI